MRAPRAQTALAVALLLGSASSHAATIRITPSSSFADIEVAQAGDTVLIAPGTYRFRVYLNNPGTPDAKITLRGEDPDNPPLWDLSGANTATFPGSYGGGDNGRGCWQVAADHYVIENVRFKGCRSSSGGESAGIRHVFARDLLIRNVLFEDSDSGVGVVADETVIEQCAFRGNRTGIAQYGGTLTARFNSFVDQQLKDFDLYGADATIEYNWLARAGDGQAHMSVCERFCGTRGVSRLKKLTFVGNFTVLGPSSNPYRHLVLYTGDGSNTLNSGDDSGLFGGIELQMAYNTFVGRTDTRSTLDAVILGNADTRIPINAFISNNVFIGAAEVATVSAPGNNHRLEGSSNWVETGTAFDPLTGTLAGSSAGLDADYRPLASSPLRNAAGTAIGPPIPTPAFEYFQNETDGRKYRERPHALDIGAFSFGNTNPPLSAANGGGSTGGAERARYRILCASADGLAPLMLLFTGLLLRRRRA